MTSAHIIHVFSGLAGAIGGGLAPLPGSDAPALVFLQASMIQVTQAQCAEIALPLAATVTGRNLSALVLGRVPGLGSLVNGATAMALTEAVGWAADAWLREHSVG